MYKAIRLVYSHSNKYKLRLCCIQSFQYNFPRNLLEIKDGGMNCSDNMDLVLKEGVSAKELSRYNQLWVKYTFQAAENKPEGFAFQLNFTSFGKRFH